MFNLVFQINSFIKKLFTSTLSFLNTIHLSCVVQHQLLGKVKKIHNNSNLKKSFHLELRLQKIFNFFQLFRRGGGCLLLTNRNLIFFDTFGSFPESVLSNGHCLQSRVNDPGKCLLLIFNQFHYHQQCELRDQLDNIHKNLTQLISTLIAPTSNG